ncbi:unnamed protein product [Amaranthus hypochondriacus]
MSKELFGSPIPLCNSDNNQDDRVKFFSAAHYSSTYPLRSYRKNDGAPDFHKDHLKEDDSWLPDKSTLELVLDTLQRKDAYDIFAEPVDPAEVEEYYEIIKEPMDFGTMRAKLHESMYKNLQQFKHDIYLIFRNALHFNSSNTVYFRQARILDELARKVFHVLETDPENFKLEFTTTRRRSSRRLDGELSSFTSASCRNQARDSTDLHLKAGNKRQTSVCAYDRRSTYKPWMCLQDEASSIISPINGTKPLTRANEADVRYKESLMLFVKDLGPTAGRVAERKLQELKMQGMSSLDMKNRDSETAHDTRNLREAGTSKEGPAIDKLGNLDLNQTRVLNSQTASASTLQLHCHLCSLPHASTASQLVNNMNMSPSLSTCFLFGIPLSTYSTSSSSYLVNPAHRNS